MDIDFVGLEVDPRNPQVLGDLGARKWQGSSGDFPDSSNSVLAAATKNNEWLMLEGYTKDGVVNQWGKLKISDDDWRFHSPKKSALKSKNLLSSPVSTLVCWSPQAASAPPFKLRRAAEMEADTNLEISV